MPPRSQELARNLQRTQAAIGDACSQAERPEGAVTLVVVTKFFPASDVRELVDLGVRHIGESRPQEMRDKLAEIPGEQRRHLTVHFIGQLQKNKAALVARHADVVHSVDSLELAEALSRGAVRADTTLDVTVQVSLDGNPQRGGAPIDAVISLCDAVAGMEALRLVGVMAIPPLGADAVAAYQQLMCVSEQVRQRHPEATWISAGMSGDLTEAISAGSTHVRVGTAILGQRPQLG